MKTELKQLKELGTIEAVTGGRNGYPAPEVGLAFIPNDEEALKEAQLLIPDCELHEFHSRDGWLMVESNGRLFDLDSYKLTAESFGDNYIIIEVEKEEDIKEAALNHLGYESWGYNSWAEMQKSEGTEDEEIEGMKNSIEILANNLEVGSNLLHNGIWETTLSNLGYSHDTHNYMIGLFIDKDTEEGAKLWEEEYK